MIPEELAEFAEDLARQIARSAKARGATLEEALYYVYLCTIGVLNDEMERVEVVKGRRGVSKRLPPPEPIAEEILMCVKESLETGRPKIEKYDYYAF
ncbi:MAG: hypothetical protein ACP5I3_10350 [Thermoproteus sp.]